MKAGNSEAISHTWQFAHLKHYFGNDSAAKSVHPGKVQSIADRQNGLTAGDPGPINKRPAVGQVCSEPFTRISS
jgi:hypothetical protein